MISARIALALMSACLGGCSFVLDFDKPVDAAPPDGPATPEECNANEPNDTPNVATALPAPAHR
jgi:hypothetical protein